MTSLTGEVNNFKREYEESFISEGVRTPYTLPLDLPPECLRFVAPFYILGSQTSYVNVPRAFVSPAVLEQRADEVHWSTSSII